MTLEAVNQQVGKKETLSEMANFILQGLKPMDVNTSFDEEVPEEEQVGDGNSSCLHLL